MADINATLALDVKAATKAIEAIGAKLDAVLRATSKPQTVRLETSAATRQVEALEKQVAELQTKISNVEAPAPTKVTLGGAAGFVAVNAAVDQLSQSLTSLQAPFLAYEAGMKEVQAITGVSDEVLAKLGDSAQELALKFGGSATTQLDAFKGVLSRFGPDIAKAPEALASMSDAINTLAKAGGIDAAQSMDVLTNSALQFGVDLSNPTAAADELQKMMQTLAASAQVGAAEIPQVGEAVVVAGAAARGARISFEETNGAIQTIAAAAGKYGAEAGTGLRNVIGLLQKNSSRAKALTKTLGLPFDELGEILTTKGLGAALERLNGALDRTGSAAERNAAVMQIFGVENAAVASSLLTNTSMLKTFTAGVTDTNSGTQQAAINMGSVAASIDRVKASVEVGLIGAFSALGSGFNTFTGAAAQVAPTLTTLLNFPKLIPDEAKNFLVKSGGQVVDFAKRLVVTLIPSLASTSAMAGTTGFSFSAMWAAATAPVALVIAAIAAVGAAFVLLYKYVEPFRDAVDSAFAFVMDAVNAVLPLYELLGETFLEIGGYLFDSIIAPFQILYSLLGDLAGALFGVSDGAADTQAVLDAIRVAVDALSFAILSVKALFGALRAGVTEVVAVFQEIVTAVVDLDFGKAQDVMKNAGDRIGNAFMDGAKETVNADLLERAIEGAAETITATAKITIEADKAESLNTLVPQLNELQNQLKPLQLKVDAGTATADELKRFDSLIAASAKASAAIADIAPSAATGISTVTNSAGEIVQVYDIASDKALKFAADAKASVSDEVQAQAEKYSGQVGAIAKQYEEQRGAIEQAYKKADEYQRAGNGAGAREQIAKARELTTQYKATGEALDKAFKDGAAASLLTEAGIKRVAQAKGISVDKARELVGLIQKQNEETKTQQALLDKIAGTFAAIKGEANEAFNAQKGLLKDAALELALAQKEGDQSRIKAAREAYNLQLKRAREAFNEQGAYETIDKQIEELFKTSEKKEKKGKSAGDALLASLKQFQDAEARITAKQKLSAEELAAQQGRAKLDRAETLEIAKRETAEAEAIVNKAKELFAITTDNDGNVLKVEAKGINDDDRSKVIAQFEQLQIELRKKRLDEIRLQIEGGESWADQIEKILDGVKSNIDNRLKLDVFVTDPKAAERFTSETLSTIDKVIADANARLTDTRLDAKELDETRKALKAATELRAKYLKDVAKMEREAQDVLRRAEIDGIEDAARRAFEARLFELDKARRKELENEQLTQRERTAIADKFAKQRADAESEYIEKTNLIARGAAGIFERLSASASRDPQKDKEAADALRAIDKEISDLRASYAKGGIAAAGFNEELAVMMEKRAELARQVEGGGNFFETIFGAVTDTAKAELLAQIDGFISDANARIDTATKRYTEANERVADIEAERERVRGELVKAQATGDLQAATDAQAELDQLTAAQGAKQAEAASAVTAAWVGAGELMAGSLAEALVNGEASLQGFVGIALDALDSMLPIIVAQIFGLYSASPNPANVATFGATGAIAAAAVTAIFKGLVAAARAALRLNKGAIDLPLNGNPRGVDTIPAWLDEGESVITRKGTRKRGRYISNADVLRAANKGLAIDQFVIDRLVSGGQLATALRLHELGISLASDVRNTRDVVRQDKEAKQEAQSMAKMQKTMDEMRSLLEQQNEELRELRAQQRAARNDGARVRIEADKDRLFRAQSEAMNETTRGF